MKFVKYSDWSIRARGATPSSHPIGATLGVTLHWEGPHMGAFSHDRCDDKVRSIQAFHRDTRGWADIAYNAVVCPHGYVFEGRGVHTKSAANGSTQANDDWYAVCYLGGEGDPFTAEGKQAFIDAVQWLRREGAAGSRVNGHRDHKATACPGDAIYAWLKTANFNVTPPPVQTTAPRPRVRQLVQRKVCTFNVCSHPIMAWSAVKDDMVRVRGFADLYAFQELKPRWYRRLLKQLYPLPKWQMRRLGSGESLVYRNDLYDWGLGGTTRLHGVVPFVCGARNINWLWLWDKEAGARISFASVHFTPKKNKVAAAGRAHAEGMRNLKGWIWAQLFKSGGRHIIIGGDFNCSAETIRKVLGDSIAGMPVTILTSPDKEIDHIVLVGHFKVGHQHQVGHRYVHSDHLPFAVEVTAV